MSYYLSPLLGLTPLSPAGALKHTSPLWISQHVQNGAFSPQTHLILRRYSNLTAFHFIKKKKVAIVGGGISGLLACKYALSKGYHPVVFESQSHLGGVWVNTLETTRLQTPRPFFQFSDHPWPSSVEEMNPTGEQVLDYLQSYADHFGLLNHFRFNTKVLTLRFDGASEQQMSAWRLWNSTGEGFGNTGKWTLLVQHIPIQSQQEMQFDFVILCIGRFSDLPNMPEFPDGKGPEVFGGEVMHSKDYSALDNKAARELVKGKRVVVVGFQKSALDIANQCALANGKEKPCHLLYRTPRWNLLDFSAWGLPYSYLYFNRFSEFLLHKPGEGLFHSLLATALSPIRWMINKFVESDVKHRTPLEKYGIVPRYDFLEAASSCVFAITPEGFYDHVDEGSIVLKNAKKFSFCEEGVVGEGEEKVIEADLVIIATGFKGDQKLRDIFASSLFQDCIMGTPNSIVSLYRQCIHPRIPQLGVIGYSESISNLYTSEMRCRWLVELLDGTFKLPEIKYMEKDISRWEKYMKRYAPNHYRRSCIGILHIWYNDQLCKDMGWSPNRKKGWFSELFEPYGPWDYANSS